MQKLCYDFFFSHASSVLTLAGALASTVQWKHTVRNTWNCISGEGKGCIISCDPTPSSPTSLTHAWVESTRLIEPDSPWVPQAHHYKHLGGELVNRTDHRELARDVQSICTEIPAKDRLLGVLLPPKNSQASWLRELWQMKSVIRKTRAA